MTFSYQNIPCFTDQSLARELARCTEELSRQYAKALDQWLKTCIESFCPEVLPLVESKTYHLAIQALNNGDFHYAIHPDHTVEFRKGNTVLARCRFEVNLFAGIKA